MSPALANHLLQSTIFAAIATLLTLTLRNNHARTRYWVWLTASMKFLIPFSLFIEIGHRLTWSSAPALITQPQVSFVMNEISQPFAASPAVAVGSASSIIPMLLLAVWVCGATAVLLHWFARWLRIAASLRTATPLKQGREFESLQRLGGTTKLLLSSTNIEPGVFGILQPLLSLPSGIADHLDDLQLDAIIAHELAHIRRNDNLTAALHMLVEAIFWFHPLVWWLGTRLAEERERACDEEVVCLGGDPEVYAESILKICRYYLATPLPCAAGISGSDLRKRIETIMANAALSSLSNEKKMCLGVAAFLALTTPVAIGAFTAPVGNANLRQTRSSVALAHPRQLITQSTTAPPPLSGLPAPTAPPPPLSPESPAHFVFDAALIKPSPPAGAGSRYGCSGGPGSKDPNRFTCTNMSALYLITRAYDVNSYQLIAPAYEHLPPMDVTATMPAGTTKEHFQLMLRALLADRFGLTLHSEKKETPVYELVAGKSGTKVKPHEEVSVDDIEVADVLSNMKSGADGFPSLPPNRTMLVISKGGRYQVSGETMETVAAMFSHYVDRPVIDKTGLRGKYDFSMYWMPTRNGEIPPPDAPGPTFTQAIEQQLGFRLVAAKDPMDVLVVDHLEKSPTEN